CVAKQAAFVPVLLDRGATDLRRAERSPPPSRATPTVSYQQPGARRVALVHGSGTGRARHAHGYPRIAAQANARPRGSHEERGGLSPPPPSLQAVLHQRDFPALGYRRVDDSTGAESDQRLLDRDGHAVDDAALTVDHIPLRGRCPLFRRGVSADP